MIEYGSAMSRPSGRPGSGVSLELRARVRVMGFTAELGSCPHGRSSRRNRGTSSLALLLEPEGLAELDLTCHREVGTGDPANAPGDQTAGGRRIVKAVVAPVRRRPVAYSAMAKFANEKMSYRS